MRCIGPLLLGILLLPASAPAESAPPVKPDPGYLIRKVTVEFAAGERWEGWSAAPMTAGGKVEFGGTVSGSKTERVGFPLGELASWEGTKGKGGKLERGGTLRAGGEKRSWSALSRLGGDAGLLVFARFQPDLSCRPGSECLFLWVRDEDRRSLIHTDLPQVRRIVWTGPARGPVRLLRGVPTDLPVGKGNARLLFDEGRREMQSFDPALGRDDLFRVLGVLPYPGGVEDAFPLWSLPFPADHFATSVEWVGEADKALDQAEETLRRMQEHPLPPGFEPLREAVLGFYERRLVLHTELRNRVGMGDLGSLEEVVLPLFSDPTVSSILATIRKAKVPGRALDGVAGLLDPYLTEAFLFHGEVRATAESVLSHRQVRVVEDPRLAD